jgi:biotin carboxyl carrier protein
VAAVNADPGRERPIDPIAADPRAVDPIAVDPRAVRVSLAPSATADFGAIVVEPAAIPIVPIRRSAPGGSLGSGPRDVPALALGSEPAVPAGLVLVDGAPTRARLERRDETHTMLVEEADGTTARTSVVMLPPEASGSGTVRREVIVDGWRIVVEIESEQRATLRERARRGRDETAGSGRTELRAVIPGRILSVSVAPGDAVTAGQQVMVIEAMKMQNELRAPRDGVVGRVDAGPGRTVELGDLLLTLE